MVRRVPVSGEGGFHVELRGADEPAAAEPAAAVGKAGGPANTDAVAAEPFDHDLHRNLGVDINENCGACHESKDDGTLLICLMGHAGQGPCVPLWVPREEVTLTVQPNDIILRFDDMTFDW